MSESVKHQTESNRDAHDLIERAKKFSVRLPVVGTVRVPPPDQLAFYGALGIFAALNVIDWPVAVAVGAGQAVLARHLRDRDRIEAADKQEAPAAETQAKTPEQPAKETHQAERSSGTAHKAAKSAHS